MTDTAKLVERLRRGREGAPTWNDILNLCDEAADAIEALSSAQADTDARVKAAVVAERERGAKIADAVEKDAEDRYQSRRAISDKFEFGREDAASDIAAAIRSGKSGAKQ